MAPSVFYIFQQKPLIESFFFLRQIIPDKNWKFCEFFRYAIKIGGNGPRFSTKHDLMRQGFLQFRKITEMMKNNNLDVLSVSKNGLT